MFCGLLDVFKALFELFWHCLHGSRLLSEVVQVVRKLGAVGAPGGLNQTMLVFLKPWGCSRGLSALWGV